MNRINQIKQEDDQKLEEICELLDIDTDDDF